MTPQEAALDVDEEVLTEARLQQMLEAGNRALRSWKQPRNVPAPPTPAATTVPTAGERLGFAPHWSDKDRAKVAFINEAIEQGAAAFKPEPKLPTSVEATLDWMAASSAAKVRDFRERAIAAVEEQARAMRDSGEVDAWFRGADPDVKRVAHGVNGPLLSLLADAIGHSDPDVVEFFREACARAPRAAPRRRRAPFAHRQGAPLVGLLPRTGLGTAKEHAAHTPLSVLTTEAPARNAKFLGRGRADPHADALHSEALKESELGRVTKPEPAAVAELEGAVLVPRFGVEQGLRPDGSIKVRRACGARACARRGAMRRQVRPVDDCSVAGINAATQPQESMGHNTVDALCEACHTLQKAPACLVARAGRQSLLGRASARLGRPRQAGEKVAFWKADIDAAFRRIPIRPDHRHLAHVVYQLHGEPWTVRHNAMPFGAGGMRTRGARERDCRAPPPCSRFGARLGARGRAAGEHRPQAAAHPGVALR